VANGGKDRGSRESRERTRVYQARQAYRDGQARRRTRDNLIAGIAGGLLILGVVAAQTAYFVAGPGAPTPSPTSTPIPTISPSVTPTPTTTPSPTATP
jgi:hypothetical protein